MAKQRLYRVFEPMLQYAVFEVYASSKVEALGKILSGEGEAEFRYTDEPMPDHRRRVTAELWRDSKGRIQYAHDAEGEGKA